MTVAPRRKARSFQQRLPGIENSSTTTSEQAMQTKEPAAMLEKTISQISPALETAIPRPTPSGVAQANKKTSWRQSLKSVGKVLTREIPRELDAAPLWMMIAMSMFKTEAISLCRPRARPSKTECTESASNKMNGVMLGQQLVFFLISAIDVLRSTSSFQISYFSKIVKSNN